MSYNRPKFSPCASWNASAISYNIENYADTKTDGIFINTYNTVYVVSQNYKTITLWQETSAFPIDSITCSNKDIFGVFVDTDGNVYFGVEDSRNRVIKRTTSKATVRLMTNIQGNCYGLFIDINNILYCSMRENHTIVKNSLGNTINSSLITIGTGNPGFRPNELHEPEGIFVDEFLRLYVADKKNNRIQRFNVSDLNGTTVAGIENETIELNEPTAIVLDADNYLFIVDSKNHRIIGQSPDGFRCVAGCNKSVGTQMKDPRMLSFDSLGNIYVTDKDANEVHVFLLSNNYCSKFTLNYWMNFILFLMTNLV